MSPEGINAEGIPCVSIAIFAWNEEAAIAATLRSLFHQSLFAQLSKRNLTCEIICVGNGCTDRTPIIAAEMFGKQSSEHPYPASFKCRVVNLAERGKLNAWNQYVHSLSARSAQFLFMMDADIRIHRHETLWNMFLALSQDAGAGIAVDRPCKDISFKSHKSLPERLSLGAAQMTAAAEAQLCAQLYCIRAEVARNIYLPKDLAACEDGFIKALVCTDFLTHEVKPERVRLAQGAEHTFEAYTSLAAIFKNQKRQIIGQTIVHLLIDDYLKTLPLPQRLNLAQALIRKDNDDPRWLKRLIREHLQRTRYFWQLYPGLLQHRFRGLAKLSPMKRLICFPSAAASFFITLVAAFMAWLFLKAGSTDYWPRAERAGFAEMEKDLPAPSVEPPGFGVRQSSGALNS